MKEKEMRARKREKVEQNMAECPNYWLQENQLMSAAANYAEL